MKKLFAYSVLLCIVFSLFGCSTTCQHNWSPATCTAPRTCSICGATEGVAVGHTWLDATCTTAKTCSICGTTQGNALGHRYSEGYCIRCDEKDPDYKEYGSVQGEITYKYNNYVGNRGDTGAIILLIAQDVKSLPDRLGLGMMSENPDKVYNTTANGTGAYSFDHIPAGEYYIVVISKNTNENPDRVYESRTWGPVLSLFSEKGQSNAMLTAQTHKTRNDTITVYDKETTNFSYDFGITYI